MHNNKKRNTAGFTLIELIMYIVIFGVVATLGTTVLDLTIREKIAITSSNDVQTALTQSLSRMLGAVHLSSGIVGASSTLSLSMSASAENPTTFSLSNGAIFMKRGSGAAAAITPSSITVTALTFTLFPNTGPSTSSVQIIVTAGYNKNGALDPNTLYTLQGTALPG